jgi:hypothetical protein
MVSVEPSYEKQGQRRAFAVAPGSAARHDALTELQLRVEHLMEIVEGVRNERWAADGRRLKDTPEWCALYVARCALQRLAEEEWKALPQAEKYARVQRNF